MIVMACYAPLRAYYSKFIGASGKRGITFERRSAYSGVPLKLPCGQCIGCRLEHSRQWAMRCMHEKQVSSASVFVTLTYDDEHMPVGGSLVKRDIQLFMKRLRKEYGNGIRFFACGEYGERTRRPHYHVLLYNIDFGDKRYFKQSKGGFPLYTSQSLERLWSFGHCLLGAVTFDSAAYVARYIVKKVTGDRARDHYEVVDSDGIIHHIEPEFTVMSRRPGIGLRWYQKFGDQVYVWDSCIMNSREVRPPRYYDVKFELLDPERMALLKLKRRRAAAKHLADNRPDRLRVREVVATAALAQKGREL